ncbi:hypothetical protein ACL07V_35460 [Streptomyces sp. MB22_4]|uniref:hypothetical protein n=1 Tax=Streptomyces sp. MB22_4 TaxID=3383120 RepID=UPI0039A14CE5
MKRGDRHTTGPRRSRGARPRAGAPLVVLALAAGLVGCGRAGGHPASPSPVPDTPGPTAPALGGTSANWCEGKVPYDPGAHYAGQGPHPAVLIQLDDPSGGLATAHPLKSLPSPWAPRVHDGREDTQLVVCTSPRSTGRTVGECDYGSLLSAPHRIDVVDTTYDVTVRAADTGHLVTTVALRADADPQDSCPTLMPQDAVKILRAPTPTAIAARLRPVLAGPAR